jgi:uncharacterized membrane protein
VLEQIITAPRRTLEEDPAFGLVMLAEIASRALSDAVNDSGSALSAITAMTRLLTRMCSQFEALADNPADRVFMAPPDPAMLVTHAFRPVARDGADRVEVGISLQRALGVLVAVDEAAFGEPARAMSREALVRAEAAMQYAPDVDVLKAAAPFE